MESQATTTAARADSIGNATDAEHGLLLKIDRQLPQPEGWLSICRSEKSLQLMRKAGQYAHAAHPVMIVGECGKGRRQVARYIHVQSKAKSLQVVRIACGQLALDESLNGAEWARLSRPLLDGACNDESLVWLFENVDRVPLAMQACLIELLEKVSATQAERSHPAYLKISLGEGRCRAAAAKTGS